MISFWWHVAEVFRKGCHPLDRGTRIETTTVPLFFLKILRNTLFYPLAWTTCRWLKQPSLVSNRSELILELCQKWSCTYDITVSIRFWILSLCSDRIDWMNCLDRSVGGWCVVFSHTWWKKFPLSVNLSALTLTELNCFKYTEANDTFGQLWLTVHLPKLSFTASFVPVVIHKSWRFYNSLTCAGKYDMSVQGPTHRMSVKTEIAQMVIVTEVRQWIINRKL